MADDELDMLADQLEGGARDYPTPGALARALEPRTVQTPALDLLDAALVDAAEGRHPRLIFTMPPQEGKSERVSRWFVLWLLLRNPDLRIGVVSYQDAMSRRWGKRVRKDIEAHPELGLVVSKDSRAANEWQIEGRDGGLITSSIRGSLTGRPLDVLILDDPIKGRKEAASEVERETLKDFWRSTGSTRLTEDAPVVDIQTRWHEDDFAGWRLAEDPEGWRHLNIPALADHSPEKGETDLLGREPGEWMVSARGRTTRGWEKRRKDAGAYDFAALYQGRPTPGEGGIIKRGWWVYYPRRRAVERADGTWHALGATEVIQTWDLTFKDTKGSDWVVGLVIARRGSKAWLLDRVKARADFPATCQLIRETSAKWPQATAKYIEDKANGPAVIAQLRKEIGGIIAITPEDSKEARAHAVTPFIEAGDVEIPDPSIAPWVGDFVEECVVGSTMILTRLGLVRADEIKVGDEVLTHLGRFRPVTATSQREAPETVEIYAKTLDPLVLTPEHPVFAMDVKRNASGLHAPVGKGWVKAGDVSCRAAVLSSRGQVEPSHKPHHAMTFPVLDADYELQEIDLRAWYDTSVPAPKTEGLGRRTYGIVDDGETIRVNMPRTAALRYRQPLDHAFGRICGLYLAEGSYSTGRAFWSFHIDETDYQDEVRNFLMSRWGVGSYLNRLVKHNGANVAASLPRLETFFEEFGRGASNKRIPSWAWEAPAEFIEGMISGWLDGDGHKVENGWVGSTASAHLAWGMRALATRINKWATISRSDPAAPSLIKGRSITPRHGRFSVSLYEREKTTHVFDGEHVGLWVKETKRFGSATVYNFSVAEDESYVTTGGTVHNCSAFPNGAHDDQVDALTQGLHRLFLGKGGADRFMRQLLAEQNPGPPAQAA